jgi:hypothetical protein
MCKVNKDLRQKLANILLELYQVFVISLLNKESSLETQELFLSWVADLFTKDDIYIQSADAFFDKVRKVTDKPLKGKRGTSGKTESGAS